MFIVYSPEGQSFIGAPKATTPPLKVDPLKRSSPIKDDVKEGFNLNENIDLRASNNTAVHAYKATKATQKHPTRRVVVKVAEIMSSPVKVILNESSIEEAWLLMQEHQIQHLPVTNLEGLIGICSQRDVLNRIIVNKEGKLEGAKREMVADVMHTRVITTTADTDIRHVANMLTQHDIGALVIMDDFQQPVGIVTRGDIIKRFANEPPLKLYI
ncbi:hypothetical protein MNBD_GAMMA03-960 [hydrothermal vent metagenome]|uniref:CBS domain-containing protein n=1 Tax=hydrothermal vent metagenome TaxID=652676 RepID=A0A3B0VZD8_9ZZZZ